MDDKLYAATYVVGVYSDMLQYDCGPKPIQRPEKVFQAKAPPPKVTEITNVINKCDDQCRKICQEEIKKHLGDMHR